MFTLVPEIHGWRCAIYADESVIRVSKAWALHRFILLSYWYCLFCELKTKLNHTIKMVIYPTQERDDDVVDPEHRDDDFEDVGQEVD